MVGLFYAIKSTIYISKKEIVFIPFSDTYIALVITKYLYTYGGESKLVRAYIERIPFIS